MKTLEIVYGLSEKFSDGAYGSKEAIVWRKILIEEGDAEEECIAQMKKEVRVEMAGEALRLKRMIHKERGISD